MLRNNILISKKEKKKSNIFIKWVSEMRTLRWKYKKI